MRRVYRILGLVAAFLLLSVVVLPIAHRMGWVAVATEFDRGSGETRRVFQAFDLDLYTRSGTPTWTAKFATPRDEQWVTVHRSGGRHRGQWHFRWSGAFLRLQRVGENLDDMKVGEEVRAASAEAALRLMSSGDDARLIEKTISNAFIHMLEHFYAGETITAADVHPAFRNAEAEARSALEP